MHVAISALVLHVVLFSGGYKGAGVVGAVEASLQRDIGFVAEGATVVGAIKLGRGHLVAGMRKETKLVGGSLNACCITVHQS